jgi:membrane-associated protein
MSLITDALAAIDALPLWQLYLLVGVLLVAETTVGVGLVTPGEVTLLAAATTVSTPGELAGLAAVAAGASLIGQTGGYLLGLRFGGRIRASWVGRKVGEPNWTRAEELLRGGSGRGLIGSRFLAVAHSLVPVVAGTLRMPPHRFGRYTAIGVVAWAIVYVALGSAGSAAIRGSAHLIGPGVTGAVVVAVGVALIVRHVRRRRVNA